MHTRTAWNSKAQFALLSSSEQLISLNQHHVFQNDGRKRTRSLRAGGSSSRPTRDDCCKGDRPCAAAAKRSSPHCTHIFTLFTNNSSQTWRAAVGSAETWPNGHLRDRECQSFTRYRLNLGKGLCCIHEA